MQSSINQELGKEQGLSDKALDNLTAIEDEIETSSQYFKPKPDKVYMLAVNRKKELNLG